MDTITTEETQFLERLVNSQVTLPYQLTGNRKLAGAAWSKETSAPLTKWDRLLAWQMEWKQKLKDGLRFYFDVDGVLGSGSDTLNSSSGAYSRRTVTQKVSVYKKRLLSHGARIIPFFSSDPGSVNADVAVDVDVLITYSDLVAGAAAEFKQLKVWDYDKLGRFLQKLELDFRTLGSEPKEPNDNHQPEDRLSDVHYFNSRPHVYLYFILQTYRPLIIKEWDIATLNKTRRDRRDLPYPVLKNSTYGRCPFVSDDPINETSADRIRKRYVRDRMNERYAVRLRRLYLRSARPDIRGASNVDTGSAFTDRQLYDYFNPERLPTSASSFANLDKLNLRRQNTVQPQFKSFSENFDRLHLRKRGNERNNLDGILEADEDTGAGNMEFISSSDDTLETVDMSQEDMALPTLCHYQYRSSLNLAELYSSDNVPQGSDVRPSDTDGRGKIDLNIHRPNYCQNCRTFFQESISQHLRTESHQRYASDESQFSQIDRLLRILNQ